MLTVPFSSGAVSAQVESGEMRTYRDMLTRALVPRFVVLEASVNPLPLAGVVIRKNAENLYDRTKVTPSLNLVRAVTAGFEEPYALSLFLGKVVDFAPGAKTLRRRKKGYVGYLASAGNYHIMENLLIPDNWLEVEAKIKGDLMTDARKMSWSFRAGRKFHANREVTGLFYLGLRRDRIDFEKTPLSFLLSSGIEYRADFSSRNFKPIGHFVMLHKNLPVGRRKLAFSLGIGYLWSARDKYSGSLAQRRRSPESQVLLRPNLKF